MKVVKIDKPERFAFEATKNITYRPIIGNLMLRPIRDSIFFPIGGPLLGYIWNILSQKK